MYLYIIHEFLIPVLLKWKYVKKHFHIFVQNLRLMWFWRWDGDYYWNLTEYLKYSKMAGINIKIDFDTGYDGEF